MISIGYEKYTRYIIWKYVLIYMPFIIFYIYTEKQDKMLFFFFFFLWKVDDQIVFTYCCICICCDF